MNQYALGEFMLMSQTFNTLVKNNIVEKGVIISKLKDHKKIFDSNIIKVINPFGDFNDFLFFIKLCFYKNINIVWDVPAKNIFRKLARLFISLFITANPFSKFLFLSFKKDVKKDVASKITSLFSTKTFEYSFEDEEHLSQCYINSLHAAKIIDRKIKCEYTLEPLTTEPLLLAIKLLSRDYICVHAFASDPDRCLPVEWWVNLVQEINKLYKKPVSIVFLGAKNNYENAEKITCNFENVINLCGKTSLTETLSIISKGRLAITCDSGICHMAALFKDLDQIAVWGGKVKNFPYFPVFKQKVFIADKVNLYGKNMYQYKNFTHNIDYKKIATDSLSIISG